MMKRRGLLGYAAVCAAGPLLASASPGRTAPSSPFPATVEHLRGTTLIDTRPQRIICLGLNDHDFAYALGVAPVGVTEWWGNKPYASWGWAEPERSRLHATPEVMGSRFFDYEWILSLQPDLILSTYRDVDERSYRKLSAIAPVIAAPLGYRLWAAPWEAQLDLIARALGNSAEAQDLKNQIGRQLSEARSNLVGLSGKRAAIADFREGQFVLWSSDAAASRFLRDLGLTFPPELDQLANSAGWIYLSLEQAHLLDIDLLIWPNDVRGAVENLEIFRSLSVYREGRNFWLSEQDPLASAALWFQSPLSIRYLAKNMPNLLLI